MQLIDKTGIRNICREHRLAYRQGDCPKCAARKRCEELRRKYSKKAV